ncbi:MAG: FtsX-like permease family protein [Acidobacteriia bacterium]|nr:FtsX-like permease family protein [Terriglobia bacterium]MYG04174.1 FtsX-like permease family protein [Terriglobia bacterium]MYK09540.1 FtsX-like permease family protein [Terriglobia bacterium]
MRFEFYVAQRYLRAKRRDRFFSVVTALSVAGVSAGVAALIIAMAVSNGFQASLREHLIGASSHINLLEKTPEFGIEDYQPLLAKLSRLEHVEAVAPTLYGEMMIRTAVRAKGCVLKGVDPEAESRVSQLLSKIVDGSFEALEQEGGGYPGILLGRRLADAIGARVSTIVTVLNPQGEMTPLGPIPSFKRFQVVGIFETGLFELDNLWSVTLLRDAQRALSLGDVVNSLEFRLDDFQASDEVARAIRAEAGEDFTTSTWMERNRVLFNALQTERLATAMIIGMIMLVAALNILISLVMMVVEKTKDIAILKSIGARQDQIRRIFTWQGLLIGSVGTAAGLVIGHLTCWLCERYRLISLDPEVYGLEYVPFAPRALDGLYVAIAAILISYLITIYPSGNAARVDSAEILRYE